MGQEVKLISISDLVLWSENPRDPLDPSASNRDIVYWALGDGNATWKLRQLAKTMGKRFDFSEIPTVVIVGNRPIVYDGNRRVAIAKLMRGEFEYPPSLAPIPAFSEPVPAEIPCNVCDLRTAMEHVLRKHSGLGTWQPLERDIFLHKHMGQSPTSFLLLDQLTGVISSNPEMNQGYVKQEVLKKSNLEGLGFFVEDGAIKTGATPEEARAILERVAALVVGKTITTRGAQRGKVLENLGPALQSTINLIKERQQEPLQGIHINRVTATRQGPDSSGAVAEEPHQEPRRETEAASGDGESGARENSPNRRVTRRTGASAAPPFLGQPLHLLGGETNDLYRDLVELHQYFESNRGELSSSFSALLRMGLRLIVETAANSQEMRFDRFIEKYIRDAKNSLSQDDQTTLSTQNVDATRERIVALLHIGAHNYTAAKNYDQTLALSVLVGAMLSLAIGRPAN